VSGALQDLATLLRERGGLIGASVAEPEPLAGAPLGDRAAAGERATGREAEYALLVEAIHEGYLQHYSEGRVVRPADPDLALLAGDGLYALGLARLAELGDLEAVGVLADAISACAQAHAEDRPGDAAGTWAAAAAAVGGATKG